jgi:hypothetical protein
MKRIVILSAESDYWEACYVDGKCVDQAHHLGEGSGKIGFLREVMNKYFLKGSVSLDDVLEVSADEVDDENAMETGQFPEFLSELKGNYNFD